MCTYFAFPPLTVDEVPLLLAKGTSRYVLDPIISAYSKNLSCLSLPYLLQPQFLPLYWITANSIAMSYSSLLK